ncbi:MAG: DNA repair protein RecO [Flavobacteriaceae bacterium]|nr:DNA repair protein RecO [Flavobacteriaceae bacterium]
MDKEKLIVLTSVKYKETSLIVKCFTMGGGLQSFMLKGIRKSNNKSKFKLAYFQPFSMLEIVVNNNVKSNIKFIKDIVKVHYFNTIHTDIIKQSMVFFLTEFVNSCLIEHQSNQEMFGFIEKMLLKLDELDDVSGFHLSVMWEMTKYIGIYPRIKKEDNYFNIEEGGSEFRYSNKLPELNKIELIRRLDGIKFDVFKPREFDSMQGRIVLDILIKYYRFHVEGFIEPNSVSIIKEIFN